MHIVEGRALSKVRRARRFLLCFPQPRLLNLQQFFNIDVWLCCRYARNLKVHEKFALQLNLRLSSESCFFAIVTDEAWSEDNPRSVIEKTLFPIWIFYLHHLLDFWFISKIAFSFFLLYFSANKVVYSAIVVSTSILDEAFLYRSVNEIQKRNRIS